MGTIALTLMVSVQVAVTLITGYFFWKVLRAPIDKGEHIDLPDPLAEDPDKDHLAE